MVRLSRVVRTHTWSRGSFVALAAAVGLVVGIRSIARVELPGIDGLLAVRPLSREGLGVGWSSQALWPAEIQTAALQQLVGLIVVLSLAAAAVATLNAIILLVESSASRTGELAVRAAVGATPRGVVVMLLGELRTLVLAGLALGLVLGLAMGGAARAVWPGVSLPTHLWAEPADAALAVGLVVAALAGAYVSSGVSAARTSRASAVLRGGARLSPDPGAIFGRKVLAATHVAVSGAVLLGVATLASTLDDVRRVAPGAEGTVTIAATATAPGAWIDLLTRLGDVPGLEAESLATPGALVGLGVRDLITAECGRCSIGGIPTPLVTARADHHAVTDGYFHMAGIRLLQGREFETTDGPGAPPVAIVSRTFANSSFEDGRPLGKRVRVGTGLYDWYTVVGVVEDVRTPVPGSEEVAREAVYLSARQHPPRSGVLLLRGGRAGVGRARAVIASAGFSPGTSRSVGELRDAAASPLRWTYRVAAFLALLTLLLAAHGVYLAALQTTRRRKGELAVRRAIGAGSVRIVGHVLGERLRVTAWGLAGMVFLGALVVAMLVRATGLQGAGPARYAEVSVILSVTALMASIHAALEALAVDPASTLE